MKRTDGTLLEKYDGNIEFRFHGVGVGGGAIVRWERTGRRWEDVASAVLERAAVKRLGAAIECLASPGDAAVEPGTKGTP